MCVEALAKADRCVEALAKADWRGACRDEIRLCVDK